jgi:hypothetical protein
MIFMGIGLVKGPGKLWELFYRRGGTSSSGVNLTIQCSRGKACSPVNVISRARIKAAENQAWPESAFLMR